MMMMMIIIIIIWRVVVDGGNGLFYIRAACAQMYQDNTQHCLPRMASFFVLEHV
jgi:hypothetical protein